MLLQDFMRPDGGIVQMVDIVYFACNEKQREQQTGPTREKALLNGARGGLDTEQDVCRGLLLWLGSKALQKSYFADHS